MPQKDAAEKVARDIRARPDASSLRKRRSGGSTVREALTAYTEFSKLRSLLFP